MSLFRRLGVTNVNSVGSNKNNNNIMLTLELLPNVNTIINNFDENYF